MRKNENEVNDLLENINKKYCNDNGFTPGIFGEDRTTYRLISNYSIFIKTVSALNIYEKFDEIEKKYQKLTEKDSKDDDKILEEINDLVHEYNKIADESKENFDYYYKVIFNLGCNYNSNYSEKGCGRIYDKIATEINSLLNNNYINYEKQLINIVDKIKDLNLRLKN